MKRHAKLVPLAREHHQALTFARWAKAASTEDGVALEESDLLRLAEFRGQLAAHAKREEAVVEGVPPSAGLHAEGTRLRAEHAELLDLIDRCSHPADLILLGARLETHTRWEDREFFAQLEAFWRESGA